MHVLCLFPVANNLDKIPIISKKFKDEIIPKLTSLGATEISIKFPSDGYTYMTINQKYELIPKGKGIIDNLRDIPNADFVIVCDGSGKIDYLNVVDIYQLLISDSRVCSVMGKRIGYTAIPDNRFLLERFEIFLLRKYFKSELDVPDGQCGLWGFRSGKISTNGETREIKLTAEGYDIELDLLSELLNNDFQFLFLDVSLQISPDAKSSFVYEDNIRKMEFLLKKHDKLSFLVPVCIDEFEESQTFKNLINKPECQGTWERYKKDIIDLCKKGLYKF